MRTSLEYLPQLFQLHNTLTRTKCTSEKELIYTHGALRCLRGIVGLDLPSYQGEPAGRHPPTAVISRTGAWHARAEDVQSHGPAGGAAERRKPLPFSVTLVAAAAAAFTLMLSQKKSMRRTEGGEERGNWQRSCGQSGRRKAKRIERGENETREKKR